MKKVLYAFLIGSFTVAMTSCGGGGKSPEEKEQEKKELSNLRNFETQTKKNKQVSQ